MMLGPAMDEWRALKAKGETSSVRPWEWVEAEEQRGIAYRKLGRNP